MGFYRFEITDEMNPWFRAIEVEAGDEDEASRRAEHMLFARRETGAGVTITLAAIGARTQQ